jgi:hypothetical protein
VNDKELIKQVEVLRRAINCLNLEVPQDIVTDVRNKAEVVIEAALKTAAESSLQAQLKHSKAVVESWPETMRESSQTYKHKAGQTDARVDVEALRRTYNPAFNSFINGSVPEIDVKICDAENRGWNECLDFLTPRLAGVPDGFVLVPIKETKMMKGAVAYHISPTGILRDGWYADLLAVASPPIQAAQESGE